MFSMLFPMQEAILGLLFIAKTRKPHRPSLTGEARELLACFLTSYLSKQNPSKFQCSQPLSVYRKTSFKLHRKIGKQRQAITLKNPDIAFLNHACFLLFSVSAKRKERLFQRQVPTGVADAHRGFCAAKPQGWALGPALRTSRLAPAFFRRADVCRDEPLHDAASRLVATSENLMEGVEKHQGVHLSPCSPAAWSNQVSSSPCHGKSTHHSAAPRTG